MGKSDVGRRYGFIRRPVTWLVRLGLCAIVVVQGSFLYGEFVEPWFWSAVAYRFVPATERSAIFSLGEDGAEFVRFVNRSTVPTIDILLPDKRSNAPHVFTNRWWMGFFLFPRTVHECNAPHLDPCARRIADQHTVVLALGDFPPPASESLQKPFLSFPGSNPFKGVYSLDAVEITDLQPTRLPMTAMTQEVLRTVALLLFLAIAGFLAARAFADLPGADALAASLPLGLGVTTFVVFLASWIGVPLTQTVFLVVVMSVMLASAVAVYFTGGRVLERKELWPNVIDLGWKSLGRAVLGLAGLALLLLLIAVSVGKSYTLTDPIQNWVTGGYAVAEFGSVFAIPKFSAVGLVYPLNVPLGIALFRSVIGELAPGSKAIFPLLGASLLLSLVGYWKELGLPVLDRLLGAALLATTPVFAFHMTRGMANLPFAAYLVIGVLISGRALSTGDRRLLGLGALMVGLSAWTRPEGFVLGLAAGAGLLFPRISRSQALLASGAWLASFLVLPFVWFLFAYQHLAGTKVGVGVIALLNRFVLGDVDIVPIATIGRSLRGQALALEPLQFSWGFFFLGLAACLLMGLGEGWWKEWSIDVSITGALIATLVATVLILYVWTVQSGSPTLLELALPRMLLPVASLLTAVLVPFGLLRSEGE